MPRIVSSDAFTSTLRASLKPEPADESLRNSPLDVLVVDIDRDGRRALELGLGHLGHLVISAGSLAQAIECLNAFLFDVIVCDLRLRDGSAHDIIAHARCHHCPTIIVMCDDLFECARARGHFEQALRKPAEIEELDRILRRIGSAVQKRNPTRG
jgi:DNA-binding NtrC family response regulator